MNLLSIIAALLLDWHKPADSARWVDRPMQAFAHRLEGWFNAGEYSQGLTAWLIGVVPLSLLAALIGCGLFRLSPILGWLWNVALLYLCLGVKGRFQTLRDIVTALEEGDLETAQSILTEWTGRRSEGLDGERLVTKTIALTLKEAFRLAFAPIFWFFLLGVFGLLFYRLSWFFKQHWGGRVSSLAQGAFSRWTNQVVWILDWLPVRLLAAAFALVGNFEDVIYCWRNRSKAANQEPLWPILSTGAAAIGILFHGRAADEAEPVECGLKDNPEAGHIPAIVALLWRALFLWFLVEGILSLLF